MRYIIRRNNGFLNEIAIADKFNLEQGRTKWSVGDYRMICQADPTYNKEKDIVGKYTNWLLQRMNDISDLERVRIPLKKYADGMKKGTLKNYNINSNINSYKSIDDFISAVENVMKSDDEYMWGESEMNNRRKLKGQFVVEGESKYWEIISPLTFRAERWFGRKSEWCTVASKAKFDRYGGSYGELHIFYPKDGKLERRIQVDLDMCSYFDDRNVEYDTIEDALIAANKNEDEIIMDAVNLANSIWNDLDLVYTSLKDALKMLGQGVDPKEIFDYISYDNDGFGHFRFNGKRNFLTPDGKILYKPNEIDKWFDNTSSFFNGTARVNFNGKWNLINTDGKIIYKPNEPDEWFDWVDRSVDGFGFVIKNDLWNIIDSNGKILYKPNEPDEWFERVFVFLDGFYMVKLNDKFNFMDINGRILYKPNEPDEWFDWTEKRNNTYFPGGMCNVRIGDAMYSLRSDGVLCNYDTKRPMDGLNESVKRKRYVIKRL